MCRLHKGGLIEAKQGVKGWEWDSAEEGKMVVKLWEENNKNSVTRSE